MGKIERERLKLHFRQMIFDGRVHTPRFDVYTPEGRDEAAEWLVEETVQALKRAKR